MKSFEQFVVEGRYDGSDYRDGFGNRIGGASDEGEADPTPTSALYSVLDGKRVIKKDLPLKRAVAYANAVRKSKPKADIKVQLQY